MPDLDTDTLIDIYSRTMNRTRMVYLNGRPLGRLTREAMIETLGMDPGEVEALFAVPPPTET